MLLVSQVVAGSMQRWPTDTSVMYSSTTMQCQGGAEHLSLILKLSERKDLPE